jgi:hypothetical protein
LLFTLFFSLWTDWENEKLKKCKKECKNSIEKTAAKNYSVYESMIMAFYGLCVCLAYVEDALKLKRSKGGVSHGTGTEKYHQDLSWCYRFGRCVHLF